MRHQCHDSLPRSEKPVMPYWPSLSHLDRGRGGGSPWGRGVQGGEGGRMAGWDGYVHAMGMWPGHSIINIVNTTTPQCNMFIVWFRSYLLQTCHVAERCWDNQWMQNLNVGTRGTTIWDELFVLEHEGTSSRLCFVQPFS